MCVCVYSVTRLHKHKHTPIEHTHIQTRSQSIFNRVLAIEKWWKQNNKFQSDFCKFFFNFYFNTNNNKKKNIWWWIYQWMCVRVCVVLNRRHFKFSLIFVSCLDIFSKKKNFKFIQIWLPIYDQRVSEFEFLESFEHTRTAKSKNYKSLI